MVLGAAVAIGMSSQVEREGPVVLALGDDLQLAINADPPGQHFLIAAGVHREQSIRPRDGDVFVGENGAVLDGSRVLDPADFTFRDSRWVIGRQTQQVYPRLPQMLVGREVDALAEELFGDGDRLRRVAAAGELGPTDTWFFDTDADEIVLSAPPSTFDRLEASTTEAAFVGEGVADVTIRNLEVRHYASPAQRGAIDGNRSIGWQLERVSAIDNHGAGIGVGSGMTMEGSPDPRARCTPPSTCRSPLTCTSTTTAPRGTSSAYARDRSTASRATCDSADCESEIMTWRSTGGRDCQSDPSTRRWSTMR
ncbi:hypothetical protein BH23ACT9_BH23ACT9_38270 [soil metagenome]